jgi:CRP-like cAMP-binding protein
VTVPLIQQLRARGSLSDADAERLLGAMRPVRTVRAGSDMVKDASRPEESTILLEGWAARYKIIENGKRQITQLHVPGDFVDLHSFLLYRMDHAVLALTDCQISTVTHETLEQLTSGSYELTKTLWRCTCADAAMNRIWVAQLGGADAYRRTAHLICELYVRLKIVGRVARDSFNFHVTQTDLGDTLGMSTVHMNRILMQLRDNGLVTFVKGAVTVHDFEGLKRAGGFDPTYLNIREDIVA